MPERDFFHDAVRNALLKEGWTITHDPLFISIGGIEMYVDLGAEKVIAAEKAGRKIAVEIKSFINVSPISEFHTAVGQFINYRLALAEQQPARVLYLAVPLDTYRDFFGLPFTQHVVQENHLKLIVYNAQMELITQWQE